MFMVLSMIIFGSIAPFVKNISLSSGEIALYRSLAALIVIGVFLLISKEKLNLKMPKRDILLVLFSGAALGFNWIFLFEAYKFTTVSLATLSYYFAPIILVALSPLLLKEKPSLLSTLCFCAATAGLVMIIGVGSGEDRGSLIGIILGLIAATLYATVIILNKFIGSVDGINRTFFQFVAAAVVLLPYVLFTGGINISNLNTGGIVSLITVGILHSGIAYCLYFSSVKSLKGAQVALLSYIDPLVAVFISFVFMKEKISLLQAIGGLIILLSTLINEKFASKTRAD